MLPNKRDEFYKSKSDQWLKLAQRATDVLQSNSDVDRDVWEVCSQAFQVSCIGFFVDSYDLRSCFVVTA